MKITHKAYKPRTLLDQALKIYNDRDYYRPEKARTLYKKGCLLKTLGGNNNESENNLLEALRLYRKVMKDKADFRKGVDDLSEMDFDDLIVFWSK